MKVLFSIYNTYCFQCTCWFRLLYVGAHFCLCVCVRKWAFFAVAFRVLAGLPDAEPVSNPVRPSPAVWGLGPSISSLSLSNWNVCRPTELAKLNWIERYDGQMPLSVFSAVRLVNAFNYKSTHVLCSTKYCRNRNRILKRHASTIFRENEE